MARDLTAFIVPDLRLARGAGLDLEAAGLRPAATPRHATVLLFVAAIPDGLAAAAGVTYAQMPRPRAILAAGVASIAGLPEPDVVTSLDQDGLGTGVAALRRELAAAAFAPDATVFEIAAAQTRTEYTCPMHPEVVRDEPGACPICGMDLVPRETAAMAEHAHGHAGMGPPAALQTPDRAAVPEGAYTCPMHPEVVEPGPGRCPICGMNLVPVQEIENQSTPGHGAHEPMPTNHGAHAAHGAGHGEHDVSGSHGDAGHHGTAHAAMAREAADHGAMEGHATGHQPMNHGPIATDAGEEHAAMPAMDHAGMDHSAHDMAGMAHGEMNHGMMDHAMHGGGFMSMVAMTKDLPRSADGLPMEWIDVPFGPLFPGLPGGLGVTLTLDGDGVARAAVTTEATARGLEATWAGPAASFAERLARVDPLAPVAYRLLARRALEAVAGAEIDDALVREQIRAAEWERIGSHLGWLAEFGFLIGDQWLAERTGALQIAVAREAGEAPSGLVREIRGFAGLVARAPLIDQRLADIGQTGAEAADRMRGPVLRAAGIAVDARSDEWAYQALGFVPVVRTGGDALARLQVRLAEIAASLDLVLAAMAKSDRGTVRELPLPADLTGTAEATIETPRGAARLRITVERGAVVTASLDPPSASNMTLVPHITANEEVADALVSIASLDLSPWEVSR